MIQRALEYDGSKIIQATHVDLRQAIQEQEMRRRANPGGWSKGRTFKVLCEIDVAACGALLAAGDRGEFNWYWGAIRAKDAGNDSEFRFNMRRFVEEHPEWRS